MLVVDLNSELPTSYIQYLVTYALHLHIFYISHPVKKHISQHHPCSSPALTLPSPTPVSIRRLSASVFIIVNFANVNLPYATTIKCSWKCLHYVRKTFVLHEDGTEWVFNLPSSCISFLPLSVYIFCLKEPSYRANMLTWLGVLSKDLLAATVHIVTGCGFFRSGVSMRALVVRINCFSSCLFTSWYIQIAP